jgi:hypothetical protein
MTMTAAVAEAPVADAMMDAIIPRMDSAIQRHGVAALQLKIKFADEPLQIGWQRGTLMKGCGVGEFMMLSGYWVWLFFSFSTDSRLARKSRPQRARVRVSATDSFSRADISMMSPPRNL